MKKYLIRLMQPLKPLLKPVLVCTLALTLMLSQTHDAMAARGGGRIGGGSFRSAPSRTYSAPRSGGYGGGYGGGGEFFFFPSPWLFFGGGGSLFTLLIMLAVASFLFQSFRRATEGGDTGLASPMVSVAKLQVGLLAEARSLQADLDHIALRANTNTSEGLAQVLQETTLALLRHPEYWVYGGGESKQSRMQAAEAEFNRLALAERSKVSAETLSNVGGQLKQPDTSNIVAAPAADLATAAPGEYIVVTLLVGAQGKLDLPIINTADDVRKALSAMGAISSDRLLALEVLWTPQAEEDVLTSEDMLTDYPTLKLI
jgi:uncharacterized membrane protein